MSHLVDLLVNGPTCGDACWHAREDVCRCSCGGRNHACLRGNGAEQPARTRRVKATWYQLAATAGGYGRTLEDRALEITNAARVALGQPWWAWHRADDDEHGPRPAFVATASESAVKAWPELAAWRGATGWNRPEVLWVRQDLMHLAA